MKVVDVTLVFGFLSCFVEAQRIEGSTTSIYRRPVIVNNVGKEVKVECHDSSDSIRWNYLNPDKTQTLPVRNGTISPDGRRHQKIIVTPDSNRRINFLTLSNISVIAAGIYMCSDPKNDISWKYQQELVVFEAVPQCNLKDPNVMKHETIRVNCSARFVGNWYPVFQCGIIDSPTETSLAVDDFFNTSCNCDRNGAFVSIKREDQFKPITSECQSSFRITQSLTGKHVQCSLQLLPTQLSLNTSENTSYKYIWNSAQLKVSNVGTSQSWGTNSTSEVLTQEFTTTSDDQDTSSASPFSASTLEGGNGSRLMIIVLSASLVGVVVICGIAIAALVVMVIHRKRLNSPERHHTSSMASSPVGSRVQHSVHSSSRSRSGRRRTGRSDGGPSVTGGPYDEIDNVDVDDLHTDISVMPSSNDNGVVRALNGDGGGDGENMGQYDGFIYGQYDEIRDEDVGLEPVDDYHNLDPSTRNPTPPYAAISESTRMQHFVQRDRGVAHYISLDASTLEERSPVGAPRVPKPYARLVTRTDAPRATGGPEQIELVNRGVGSQGLNSSSAIRVPTNTQTSAYLLLLPDDEEVNDGHGAELARRVMASDTAAEEFGNLDEITSRFDVDELYSKPFRHGVESHAERYGDYVVN